MFHGNLKKGRFGKIKATFFGKKAKSQKSNLRKTQNYSKCKNQKFFIFSFL